MGVPYAWWWTKFPVSNEFFTFCEYLSCCFFFSYLTCLHPLYTVFVFQHFIILCNCNQHIIDNDSHSFAAAPFEMSWPPLNKKHGKNSQLHVLKHDQASLHCVVLSVVNTWERRWTNPFQVSELEENLLWHKGLERNKALFCKSLNF